MEYRLLGQTGLKVSAICLDTMQFGWTADETMTHRVLSGAYEAGVNFFNGADIYSRWASGNTSGVAEQILGRWMQRAESRGDGAKRYFTESTWALLEQMEQLVKAKGARVSHLALAWLMADPFITSPIIGANSPEQLLDNLCAQAVHLTTEEKFILAQATAWEEKRSMGGLNSPLF
jgi:aryl-alcohol dehydrogenase-like predicted oxidoreductase